MPDARLPSNPPPSGREARATSHDGKVGGRSTCHFSAHSSPQSPFEQTQTSCDTATPLQHLRPRRRRRRRRRLQRRRQRRPTDGGACACGVIVPGVKVGESRGCCTRITSQAAMRLPPLSHSPHTSLLLPTSSSDRQGGIHQGTHRPGWSAPQGNHTTGSRGGGGQAGGYGLEAQSLTIDDWTTGQVRDPGRERLH
jgi:hypothetical protein